MDDKAYQEYMKQENRFVGNLKDGKYILNHQVQIEHVVKDHEIDIQELKPQIHLKVYTFVKDHLAKRDASYQITAIDVEHHSINQDNIFMIVNSVEEFSNESEKVIFNMLRIYKQEDNRYKTKLLEIIASTTGPISSQMTNYQRQPISLIFNGPALYYFHDVMNSRNKVLKSISFGDVGKPDVLEIGQYRYSGSSLQNDLQIFFVMDADSKGRRLAFKPEDKQRYLNENREFRDSLYIQVVEFGKAEILIYSLKDLKNPVITRDISQKKWGIKVDELNLYTGGVMRSQLDEGLKKEKTTKFLQCFVIKEGENALFVSLYNHIYYSIGNRSFNLISNDYSSFDGK